MSKPKFLMASKSVQITAFLILTNGNIILTAVQARNFGVILDSSLLGKLVLKHAGVFLKNYSIVESSHKVPIQQSVETVEIKQQSVKDLKRVTRNYFNDFQPLILEDVQKGIRKNK